MAIAIKNIPILEKDDARIFVEKAEIAYANKQTIDFSNEVKSANSILTKSNINKHSVAWF
jgi:Fe-S cluster assembly iron-binding protein IscA